MNDSWVASHSNEAHGSVMTHGGDSDPSYKTSVLTEIFFVSGFRKGVVWGEAALLSDLTYKGKETPGQEISQHRAGQLSRWRVVYYRTILAVTREVYFWWANQTALITLAVESYIFVWSETVCTVLSLAKC